MLFAHTQESSGQGSSPLAAATTRASREQKNGFNRMAQLGLGACLTLALCLFFASPATAADCCPSGVPNCCTQHDNRPAVCDGVASTCEKLGPGNCVYTHPDGTTKTYTHNDCCCVRSRDCPEATYVARCVNLSAVQSWYNDQPKSTTVSFEVAYSQPFSQFFVADNSTGCVRTISSLPPIVTDHEGQASAAANVMAVSGGEGTVSLTTYDAEGSFLLTMEKCFECSSPNRPPTELSCSK